MDGTAGRLAASVLPVADRALVCDVSPVTPQDQEVRALLHALTAELATGDYTADQTFGYSVEQLEQSNVYLVGARVAGRLVLQPQLG